MELLWFGHAGRPAILFPTAAARFYESEDFGLVGALAGPVDEGRLQLVCPDTVNLESWYHQAIHPRDRVRRHEQYDAYLRHELIPFIHHRAGRDDLATYGASFGAYHAVNLAARYPEVVRRAVAFSGVYDIHGFLDGWWDDACYFQCPTAYIANMDEGWAERLRQVEWVVATGEHDSLAARNRQFIDLLRGKGLPVQGEIWPGVFGHDWPWWRENIRRFLP